MSESIFKTGDRVVCETHGEGIVKGVDDFNATYLVSFDRYPELRIIVCEYSLGSAPATPVNDMAAIMGKIPAEETDEAFLRQVTPAAESEKRLREIEVRANAATPGPWYAHNPDDGYFMNVYCVTTSESEPDIGTESNPEIVAGTLVQGEITIAHASQKWEQDTEFIAHARADVPWLIATIRAQQQTIDALNATVAEQAAVIEANGRTTVGRRDQLRLRLKIACMKLTDEQLFTLASSAEARASECAPAPTTGTAKDEVTK